MSPLPDDAGVGLRSPHIKSILEERPLVPWFELLLDNWLAPGGLDKYLLDAIAEQYVVAFHGVNLSLGSTQPLDYHYLAQVKNLIESTQARCYSEHCSFSSFQGNRTGDLLPLPYTEEAILHISQRIREVQSFLERRILLENVSCYVECEENQMNEAQFIAHILSEADCDLLLDLNNVHVNSVNHGFDANAYVASMPTDRIKEVHLAGFESKPDFLLDCHNNPVSDEVWQLFAGLIKKIGAVPTLIEWDNDIPAWKTLEAERQKAQSILNRYRSSNMIPRKKQRAMPCS